MGRHHRDTRGYGRDPYESELRDFRSPNPQSLYRSRTDKVFAGVCGGLARRYGWDSSIVRVIFICASVFLAMFGPLIIAYLVAMLIVPKELMGSPYARSSEEEVFWREVSDRPRATFGALRYKFMDMEERLRSIEASVTSEEWRLRREFRDLES
jgi:phage shock protein C